MYSVTFAFGNVGEALAIVVMVIQVAGSGGTFPIEALPKVFQWIYPFLPFQFGMKAFKECIAGMYGVDYWINVGKMTLFLIVALLLGLALEPPFRKLNHMIEKSKEKTGLMI
jgi:putative membrane protein